jgi:small ligand-binding sensory domain FIST
MRFASGGSQARSLTTAVAEVAAQLAAGLAADRADLALVFVSHHHQGDFEQLAGELQKLFPCRVLLGSSAETVVVNGKEWESGHALSAWCATLPEYDLRSFAMEFESTADGIICAGIPEELADLAPRVRAILMLGEPYTSAPKAVLERFADDLPGVPIVGGMSSGASGPDENRLFHGDRAVAAGAVAVALLDGPPIRTVVSQGCRPVGEPFIVTKAERNIVLELGGKPALQRVQEVYNTAAPEDKRLLENGLHLGVAMTELRDSFGRGDFLVSNVMGADRASGAIAIGQLIRVGQTVQFHVRDAASADQDLSQRLAQAARHAADHERGALLFSCNGRGTRMFPASDHDAAAIQTALGPLPVAGMFAAGEIGPVGTENFLHGFTASIAVFG